MYSAVLRSNMRDALQRAMRLAQDGYSHSGIAKEMDVTESTAKKYLNQIEDLKGTEALW